MLRTFLKRLLGRDLPPPDNPLLVDTDENFVGPPRPANDRLPVTFHTRHVLRRNVNASLVMAGTTVITQNNAMMKIASGEQRPPYVRCIYRNRKLAVLPQTIGCHWDTVTEPIQ